MNRMRMGGLFGIAALAVFATGLSWSGDLMFVKGLPPLRIQPSGAGAEPESAAEPGLRNLAPAVRFHSFLPSAGRPADRDKVSRPAEKTDSAPAGSGFELAVSKCSKVEKTLDVGTPDRVAEDLIANGAEWFYPLRGGACGVVEPGLPRSLVAVDGPEAVRFKVEVRFDIPALPTEDNVEAARGILEGRLFDRYNGHPRYAGTVDKVALLGGTLRYSFDGKSVSAEFEQLVYDSLGNRIPLLEREYFVVTFDKTAKI